MTFDEFRNNLRILLNIDADEIERYRTPPPNAPGWYYSKLFPFSPIPGPIQPCEVKADSYGTLYVALGGRRCALKEYHFFGPVPGVREPGKDYVLGF
jgi:hypothetical protein